MAAVNLPERWATLEETLNMAAIAVVRSQLSPWQFLHALED